jgi:hypothetical protein
MNKGIFRLLTAYRDGCLLLGLMLLLLLPTFGQAQRFGNEWINRNQTYFKIPVGEDGIYRISYDDLQTAGFPVDNVDPRRMQLFFRGQEQAILIEGQQDASFDPADFLLFYGQRNDGTLDRELYVAPEAQGNPYYNLYSDTTAYFLTWSLAAVNGKRMGFFQENNITNIPAEPFHWKEALLQLTNQFSLGRQYPLGSAANFSVHLSNFDYGEGWTGPRLRQGQSATYSLEAPAQYTTGPLPQLEVMLTGRNNRPHDVTIEVGSSTGALRELSTVNFDYYENQLLSEALQWSDLSGGNLNVRVTVNGVDGGADFVSIAYIRLRYPQQLTAQGAIPAIFDLQENPLGKSYLEVAAPPTAPYLLDISDENNVSRIGFNLVNGDLTTIVPNTQTGRKLMLGSTKNIPGIRRVQFQNISAAANYLIVSNERLHAPAGNYSDPVRAYYDYRASAAGGSFTPILFDIDQLFDQFSYGEPTPLAIRRFADYMLSVGAPRYLLLIGKGLTVNFNYYRQDPDAATLHDLVPTGGIPGSDVVLTSGLGDSDGYGAAIPTGRINARSAAEVAAYLDKVKETEARSLADDYQEGSTREALWRKHLVHLSGGVSLAELTLFARYVDDLEARAESDFLGGSVSTQSKQSNNATELINIAEEVNQGLSMITFFGHSSTTRSDIEIGYVTNEQLGYNNKGKYPAILINGCNAGNIFSNALTFGEDWIGAADKGAINVMAHASAGISSILKRYSDAFYGTAFNDSLYIGRSIGDIKQEAGKRFVTNIGSSLWEVHIAQVTQSVLQGDPAMTLFGRAEPDYAIEADELQVVPLEDGEVTVFSDSFAIQMVVRNFGRSSRDSLEVTLNRTLENGNTISYEPVFYPPVLYQDTLLFRVNSGDDIIASGAEVGTNRFEITINSRSGEAELNPNNNVATLEYFIPIGGTVHLQPANYAIVSNPEMDVFVQAGDIQNALLSEDTRQFLIEVDTAYTFDSPVLQQFSVDASELAVRRINLPVTEDSTVYFWRSKYAELRSGEIDQWTQSSFTYISAAEPGWGQLQLSQLAENNLENLLNEGSWSFTETNLSLDLVIPGGDVEGLNSSLRIDGIQFLFENLPPVTCRANSINALAFDRYSLLPYLAVKQGGFDDFDSNSCGPLPSIINTYANSQVSGTALALENYIDNVGQGDPVLLFSRGTLDYQAWPASTRSKLQEVGVSQAELDGLPSGSPLIIVGRKGSAPGSATVLTADTTAVTPAAEQQLSLQESLSSSFSNGSITSRRIGPALEWGSLYADISSIEVTDIIKLDVIGETADGKRFLLLEDISPNTNTDLSTISASEYPYLRLNLVLEDAVNLSPSQLQNWIVRYRSLPEGILITDGELSSKDVRQEGENTRVPLRFYNLSTTDFSDSLSVAYSLLNSNSQLALQDTFKIAPLAAGDTAAFEIPVNTRDRVGENDLTVFVNPRLLREQDYDNNQLTAGSFLEVMADALNPVIDVAFDGTYIMDGDIVSPRPVITVEVRDENPFLQKEDTTGIDIFLGRQTSGQEASAGATNARVANTQLQRISLNSEEVSWTPADGEDPFRIVYEPNRLEDGVYTLRVQAEDASGNASGTEPYEINFEIINESSITNFYPYPNPFSTSTRFVFTLTGEEIPDQLKIQIMTVSGKIVREITQGELGPIRIGNNISEYAWDGRDEFGDQLANGVYLYRVIVRSGGESLELRETAGDRGFKNGFGKMYILR